MVFIFQHIFVNMESMLDCFYHGMRRFFWGLIVHFADIFISGWPKAEHPKADSPYRHDFLGTVPESECPLNDPVGHRYRGSEYIEKIHDTVAHSHDQNFALVTISFSLNGFRVFICLSK